MTEKVYTTDDHGKEFDKHPLIDVMGDVMGALGELTPTFNDNVPTNPRPDHLITAPEGSEANRSDKGLTPTFRIMWKIT
jgi:hypothetical protein